MARNHDFSVTLRVRFGETDAMGVANNAAYMSYFEVGRVEYLRWLGHSYADVHDGGMDMVVVEAGIRYLRPLRFDDEFRVACACREAGRAAFTFRYRIERGQELCTEGFTKHVCVDRRTLRPVRVPGWLRDAVHAGPQAQPADIGS
jgi:acyl-CoA thioester hydrolase